VYYHINYGVKLQIKSVIHNSGSIDSAMYIVVNIALSIVSFFRSFIFMRVLNMNELGIITLVQTIAQSIGILQIGMINGGYRIYSIQEESRSSQVNNVLFSFILTLGSGLFLIWTLLRLVGINVAIALPISLVGILIGILSLLANWLTNTLIASQKFKDLNFVNLISAAFALLILTIIPYWRISGAVLAILVQPAMFVVLALFIHRSLRPYKFSLDLKEIKVILKFGFIPFLIGVFVLLNAQLERWTIVYNIGTQALGEFYLVFLYSSLFVIIPSSLNAIFFPKIIKAYSQKKIDVVKSNLRRYYYLLSLYSIIMIFITLFFMGYLIDRFIPQHHIGLKYVHIILPGLIVILFSDPISVLLNASKILNPMLYISIISMIINIISIFVLMIEKKISLESLAMLRTFMNVSTCILYILVYFFNKKLIWGNYENQ